MARLEARQGNLERAATLLTEALSAARRFIQDFPTLAAGPLNLACIHAARGEMPEALRAFDDADRIMSVHNLNPDRLTSRAELLKSLGR